MSEIILTSENFENEVTNSNIPILIDFWATWCAPCRSMLPVVKQISEENNGIIKVCKVNIDEEPKLAEKFDIMSIPTFIAIKNGKVIGNIVGMQDKAKIMELFN